MGLAHITVTRRAPDCQAKSRHAALARQHGLVGGQRTDVVAVTSAQMITADMVPDAPGIWLYHCHISDHMVGGMTARYQVLPR